MAIDAPSPFFLGEGVKWAHHNFNKKVKKGKILDKGEEGKIRSKKSAVNSINLSILGDKWSNVLTLIDGRGVRSGEGGEPPGSATQTPPNQNLDDNRVYSNNG